MTGSGSGYAFQGGHIKKETRGNCHDPETHKENGCRRTPLLPCRMKTLMKDKRIAFSEISHHLACRLLARPHDARAYIVLANSTDGLPDIQSNDPEPDRRMARLWGFIRT